MCWALWFTLKGLIFCFSILWFYFQLKMFLFVTPRGPEFLLAIIVLLGSNHILEKIWVWFFYHPWLHCIVFYKINICTLRSINIFKETISCKTNCSGLSCAFFVTVIYKLRKPLASLVVMVLKVWWIPSAWIRYEKQEMKVLLQVFKCFGIICPVRDWSNRLNQSHMFK